MILQDGTGQCDDCGQVEIGTGLAFFINVSDFTPDLASARNLLFCRRNGCAQKLVPDSPVLPEADDADVEETETES